MIDGISVRILIPVAALLASSCASGGSVEEPLQERQPGVEELLSGSLIPSPDEERIKHEHALGGELARTLAELPGVTDARVHLSLADRSLLSRDREVESKAAIVIRVNRQGDPPNADRVSAIAAAAVRGLAAEHVEVFFTEDAVEPVETVHVGPIEVAAESAATARAILGGLLGVCLLLAAGLIYAGIKIRRLRGR
ncbi:MAG: hypothetical protein JRF63_11355 [Deltaproteobacteria bacterium]|nr:hypothetical protein [Deltaproteobacteria bacterium]